MLCSGCPSSDSSASSIPFACSDSVADSPSVSALPFFLRLRSQIVRTMKKIRLTEPTVAPMIMLDVLFRPDCGVWVSC